MGLCQNGECCWLRRREDSVLDMFEHSAVSLDPQGDSEGSFRCGRPPLPLPRCSEQMEQRRWDIFFQLSGAHPLHARIWPRMTPVDCSRVLTPHLAMTSYVEIGRASTFARAAWQDSHDRTDLYVQGWLSPSSTCSPHAMRTGHQWGSGCQVQPVAQNTHPPCPDRTAVDADQGRGE